jgi:hypothetical protein
MYSFCYVYVLLLCTFRSKYCVVLYIVLVYMCIVLMPPGVNSVAVNEYVVSYVSVVTAAHFHGNTADVNILRHFDLEYSHIR